jgi:cyclopropane-fatty-acyl-phospholipid synthase
MGRTVDNTQNKYREKLAKLIDGTGISFNGENPYDIKVYNAGFYKRVFAQGSIGLGESYMDNWWDCDCLDEMFARVLSIRIKDRMTFNLKDLFDFVTAYVSNQQTIRRASRSIRMHYDLGNDLFRSMLDKQLTYSCGYWLNATTLDEAQVAKYDLICRKLDLQPGQKILDIGCGWGGLIKYMVEKYKVSAIGITQSEEQAALGKELCKELPIEILLDDYRNLSGSFDHIVSIGMFEHVGCKNYRAYMEIARKCLKKDGLFLLHTMGANKSLTTGGDPWVQKYLFPGYLVPSLKQIGKASEGLFVVEDVHNFGAYYDNTLMAWHSNFVANWESIRANYDERFYRMWQYYLLTVAGSHRARNNQLWQIVLSPNGVPGGYVSVR